MIVAFGDIFGFGIWRERALNAPEVSDPFIENFYGLMKKFVLKNNFYVKYLGDGLMIIKEIEFKDRLNPSPFIKSVRCLTKKMKKIIDECSWPKPEGFRTRIVVGHVDKLKMPDPQDKTREVDEYEGYAINLAQRLLEIQPRTPIICHESIFQILGEKKKEFRFKRLEGVTEKPRGVNSSDISGLWSLKL